MLKYWRHWCHHWWKVQYGVANWRWALFDMSGMKRKAKMLSIFKTCIYILDHEISVEEREKWRREKETDRQGKERLVDWKSQGYQGTDVRGGVEEVQHDRGMWLERRLLSVNAVDGKGPEWASERNRRQNHWRWVSWSGEARFLVDRLSTWTLKSQKILAEIEV